MDIFLGKVTQQAMNYAIRSGVGITASFAIRQSARLLQNAPKSNDRDELVALQRRLQSKIRIISPAIDMIELIAARGNTSLESAVSLTKELRYEIQSLGQRLASAAAAAESTKKAHLNTQARARNEIELKFIVSDIKKLLERIEDAVPLINLAITTSGASLSTSLPATVSPSRLLQASTFLTAGDTQFSISSNQAVQIGPTFTLSVYMLFAGYDRPQSEEDIRETTWKEVIHKARVKLRRVPIDIVISTGSGGDALPSVEVSSPPQGSEAEAESKMPGAAARDEYAYQLMIIEDFDDHRVHDFEDGVQPGPFDDVQQAGIREMIPVHEVSKIFYADTSKVLNIGTDSEMNHPVLLLKRDINAVPPRRMAERELEDEQDADDQRNGEPKTHEQELHVPEDHTDCKHDPWRLPPSLDPEWIAFEVYTEAEDGDDESDFEDASEIQENSSANTPLTESMSQLNINTRSPSTPRSQKSELAAKAPPPWVNGIRTSLSLLELLLRLTSLQQFQQQSHLSITDELLNFFLGESATTGAGSDDGRRQALRADARRRVGWDPYDESPIKRRGEDYQYHNGNSDIDGGTPSQFNGGWSSPNIRSSHASGRIQTLSPSPSPIMPAKTRPGWLKGQEERKASPLRKERVSDEGIGTSPGSGQEGV
jgi:RanGTP-binding protein